MKTTTSTTRPPRFDNGIIFNCLAFYFADLQFFYNFAIVTGICHS